MGPWRRKEAGVSRFCLFMIETICNASGWTEVRGAVKRSSHLSFLVEFPTASTRAEVFVWIHFQHLMEATQPQT